MRKRLIAQSPQLGNLISNDSEFSSIESANTHFNKDKLYNATGKQGTYGCISYQDVKSPKDPIKLFVTEVYVSIDAGKNNQGEEVKSIISITRPFTKGNNVGNPIEIKETLSPNMSEAYNIEKETILHVNGLSLIKLPAGTKDYEEALSLAKDSIEKQFKDVQYA
jgi:quinol monooxygenase YgiN